MPTRQRYRQVGLRPRLRPRAKINPRTPPSVPAVRVCCCRQ
jgi:hypothetical protein